MVNHLSTRQLGKTGERIPILGFGTAPAGTRLSLKNAIRLYESALEAGITYFDTAPDFAGYGAAQKQLGYVLKDRRKEVFLVTKCFESSGDAALRLLERNLKELQTDYADVVFVHSLGADKMDPRLVFSRSGIYPALLKAKAHGLTRFVGLSGHNRPGRFKEAIQQFEVDVLLNAVNFVDRYTYAFESEVWPMASQYNIGMIAMKVYGGKDKSALRKLSHSLLPQNYLDAAFRYALTLPEVTCASIGMATHEELKENLKRAYALTPLQKTEQQSLAHIGQKLARQWGPHLGKVV